MAITAESERWAAFRRDEERWAKEGSGMTKDQLTGAVMYDAWLSKYEKPPLSAPTNPDADDGSDRHTEGEPS